MRILIPLTDAFGGHGGIAKFNRDLLHALGSLSEIDEVVAVPRLGDAAPIGLPRGVRWVGGATRGKLAFMGNALRAARDPRGYELVVCAHINLLPVAWLCRVIARRRNSARGAANDREGGGRWSESGERRAEGGLLTGLGPGAASRRSLPLALIIHGIDAWQPTRSPLTNWCARHIDRFISVSDFTRRRFCAWSGQPIEHGRILPDCVDLDIFTPGPRNPGLVERYQLAGRKVMMTLARLHAAERYKGIDEVLEVMPALLREIPNLVYLVCGDGTDRPRLQAKAKQLGLESSVRFAGRIPEEEKVDHYRLADAFVMPGRGEGFGIVYLEAMACGIPVVASTLDASREAVLDGELGVVVDPDHPADLTAGILEALRRGAGKRPVGLEHFGFREFSGRVGELLGRS